MHPQKTYGIELHTAEAYQIPKARLRAPRAGATAPKAPRRRADTRARPKPVERRHIETAVKTARSTRATTAKAVELTDASPDAEVELQFAPGQTFDGVVLGPDGQPMREAGLKASFTLGNNHGFELQPVLRMSAGIFAWRT